MIRLKGRIKKAVAAFIAVTLFVCTAVPAFADTASFVSTTDETSNTAESEPAGDSSSSYYVAENGDTVLPDNPDGSEHTVALTAEELEMIEKSKSGDNASEGNDSLDGLMEEQAISGLSDKNYTIETALNGQCLDVAGGSMDATANVQIYEYNGSAAQMFKITEAGSGYYKITNCNSGKVLDVKGAGTAEGTNVWQHNWNGSDAQLWNVSADGYYYVIRSKLNSNLVLTVDGTGSNGSNVCVRTYTGSTSQKFSCTEHVYDSSGYDVSIEREQYIYTGNAVTPDVSVTSYNKVNIGYSQVTNNPITGGISMPLYRQGLYTQSYGTGTIASSGCGIAAFAMVASYLTGKQIEPDDVVAWCGDKFYNYTGGGTYVGNLAPEGASHYGFTYEEATTNFSKVVAALKAGKPVISLQQNGGYFTGGDHIIVLRGITSTGGILVNDSRGVNYTTGAPMEYVPIDQSNITRNGVMYYIFGAKDDSVTFGNQSLMKTMSKSISLVKGTDFSISYSNNVNPGTATYKVTGKSAYSKLSKTGNFSIIKASTTCTSGRAYYLAPACAVNKVLDVKGGLAENCTNVWIYNLNYTDAQKFVLTKNQDGSWAITNFASGMSIDVYGGYTANCTNVQMYRANGTDAQKWNLISNSDGTFTIANAVSGKVLDVAGGVDANGTNVWMYSSNGSNAQKFYLVETGDTPRIDGTYRIQTAINGASVIDIAAASKANCANVGLYTSNGTNAQRFNISYTGNGYYKITNMNSGKALDVYGARAANSTIVWQYEYNGSKAQLWKPVLNADGTYTFYSALGNNLVLDVRGGLTANNTQIQVYSSNGSKAQKWKLV